MPENSSVFKYSQGVYRIYLNSKSHFDFWVRKIFYEPSKASISKIIDLYITSRPDLTFIQIGANDGKSNDFLFDYIIKTRWRGILVEPVGKLFIKLQQNYEGFQDRLMLENSAISNKDGQMIFFCVQRPEGSNAPEWVDGLSSFNLDVILKHKRNGIAELENMISEVSVQTITIESLTKKHAIESVQLVMIDTEGYDYEILKLINYKKLNTEIIIFEHSHLNDRDFKDSIKLLRTDFILYQDGFDIIAINKLFLDSIPQLRESIKHVAI